MYDRKVAGKTLTLFVSGMLWNQSLVMRDAQTESHWSHLLGEAMDGRLKGERLTHIPSVMTDWETWRNGNSMTTVAMLSPTSRAFRRNIYRDMGLNRFALGIVWNGKAYAWRFDHLQDRPVLNEKIGATNSLVVFDAATISARMYSRKVGEKTLSFEWTDQELRDKETKTKWDMTTGRATDGPMKGTQLELMPAIVTFTEAWIAFHPESILIPPRKKK